MYIHSPLPNTFFSNIAVLIKRFQIYTASSKFFYVWGDFLLFIPGSILMSLPIKQFLIFIHLLSCAIRYKGIISVMWNFWNGLSNMCLIMLVINSQQKTWRIILKASIAK